MFFSATLFAQTDRARSKEFCINAGYIQYRNTSAIPYGLPGVSTGLGFRSTKIIVNNKSVDFEFKARALYAYLLKNGLTNEGLNYPYHHIEIETNGVWSYQIPLYNFRIDVGGGWLFQALGGFNQSRKVVRFHGYGEKLMKCCIS